LKESSKELNVTLFLLIFRTFALKAGRIKPNPPSQTKLRRTD